MKIFSYNVNGIRAAIKKGFLNWLEEYNPDVICLQEIKANKDQLDLELFSKIGYKYNYHSTANKELIKQTKRK
jgi:exodeoxyribonuclease-3